MNTRLLATAIAVALALPAAAMACAGCGCMLDTDSDAIATGSDAGLRVDGRVDFIDQSKLRLGGKAASAADTSTAQVANGREVQHNTRTSLYTAGMDYAAEQPWGVSLAVPIYDRGHSTYSDMTNPTTPSSSTWSELGDIRLVGRYTGFTEGRDYALLLGVKLPTGSTTTTFRGGTVQGQLLDRGLQPGTGTNDLLLGFSQRGRITDGLRWFAQQMLQVPLEANNNFRPGDTVNANLGISYLLNETVTPQLQVNAQNRWRDNGVNSDRVNSGGEVVFLSPGLTLNVTEGTSVYGFVQVPLYQRVGGLELVPNYTASLGVSYRF